MSLAPSSWAASLMLHAVGFVCLAITPAPPPAIPALPPVEMTIAPEPTPPPPAPPPPVEEVHEAKPTNAAAARPTREMPRAGVPAETTALPSSDPLDLTGTVLTGVPGGTGTGIGTGTATGAGMGTEPAKPGLAIVPKESLSRLPAPPDLTNALLAHYPEKAKALHDGGQATLSIVILPSGHVGAIEVKTASAVEFGRACRDTLASSRWSPPLDRSGLPVATRVGYTCHFDVN